MMIDSVSGSKALYSWKLPEHCERYTLIWSAAQCLLLLLMAASVMCRQKHPSDDWERKCLCW